MKIIDRNSHIPYDSIDVSFYHVVADHFDFVANSLTDSNGMVKVPERFGTEGKINGNNASLTRKCIWPVVENIQNFDSGIRVIMIDRMTDCGYGRLKIENVYFAYDQAYLVDFYKSKIDSVIKMLKENPSFKIKLQGHTDNKGTDEYNIKLSQKRAEAVQSYMLYRGIKKERIILKAMGKSEPQVPFEKDGKDDPEGRARNRRVEFRIITD